MTNNIALYALIFNIAHAMLTAMVGFYVWLVKRAQIGEDRLIGIEKNIGVRLDDHDHRLSKVEAACVYSPTHQDLGKIYDRINEMSCQVNAMSGAVEALQGSVDMLHSYLLNRNGGQ